MGFHHGVYDKTLPSKSKRCSLASSLISTVHDESSVICGGKPRFHVVSAVLRRLYGPTSSVGRARDF
ncbi:hypothetical protein TNCV_1890881 [Trichonephila clavipes]|nr:hypothetical protein TNCV_1890881 [Trichonephila clavipes]